MELIVKEGGKTMKKIITAIVGMATAFTIGGVTAYATEATVPMN